MKTKTKKKSQLSMLIIVGLVLFILVGLLLYLSKVASKKITDDTTQKIGVTPIENLPFKDHVTQCLDKTAKEAIVIAGKQGGYIYVSQGGSVVDFLSTDKGVMFLENDGYKVAYNIYPLKSDTQFYLFNPPNYPWLYFPYSDSTTTTQIGRGVFGINEIPHLSTFEGPSSIQSQIESVIENKIVKCLDLQSFQEKGYRITLGRPDADAVIGNRDVIVKLNLPITLNNPTTQEKTNLKDFSVKYDIRLKEIYLFTRSIINNDVRDINFRIDDPENNKNGFSIQVVKGVFNNDDLIKIYDERSLIDSRSLEYVFARKNRAPALHFLRNEVINFPQDYDISRQDIIGTDPLAADDPDEDQLSFRIMVNGGEMVGTFRLVVPEIDFNVEVSDGSLTDYQPIKVMRT